MFALVGVCLSETASVRLCVSLVLDARVHPTSAKSESSFPTSSRAVTARNESKLTDENMRSRLSDHWVSCILSEMSRGKTGAGLDQRAAKWLDTVTDVLRPLALLGLDESRVDDVCLRVTRTVSRIPAHFDTWHNTLVQVGDGVRRVILLMPDNADRLYTAKIDASGNADHATVSRVDFRNPDAEEFPLAQSAWALPATLQPGDMLHIPAGWWHYVESASTAAVGGEDGTEMPSVALNLITVHHQEAPADGAAAGRQARESAWVEVPCPAA